MRKSYTFVEFQVTDEGRRDYEFPECLFANDINVVAVLDEPR